MTRILVIEDNPQTLEVYAAVLRAAAYDVELATTTHEELARVRRQGLDLALVDLFLPDGTAIDVLVTLARGACPSRLMMVRRLVCARYGGAARSPGQGRSPRQRGAGVWRALTRVSTAPA